MNVTRRAFFLSALFAPLLKFLPKPASKWLPNFGIAPPYTGPVFLFRGPTEPPIDYAAIQRRFRESAEWTERTLHENTMTLFHVEPSES